MSGSLCSTCTRLCQGEMKRYITFVVICLGFVGYFFFRRAETLHSKEAMILGFAFFGAALIASMFDHPKVTPEERKQRFRELLDIHSPEETKRKILEAIVWLACIFVPLLLFLRLGPMYPLLDDRLYLGLLYALPFFFLATYSIPLFRGLRRFPLLINLAGRLGLCIPAIALLFSLLLMLNCALDRSIQVRTVICLEKRVTHGSGPSYYIRVRPWSGNDRTIEVDVPESLYQEIPVGANFQLTTGRGELGIEWIRHLDVKRSKSALR